MPPGYKTKKTLAKEEAREIVRGLVIDAMRPMIEAQIAHAQGLKYLVARHKTTGKFAKLTEELTAAISAGTNPDYESIEVWSKDPSVQAFSDLMNRAIDKPKEQELEIKLTGEQEHIQRLLDGRKRAAKARVSAK